MSACGLSDAPITHRNEPPEESDIEKRWVLLDEVVAAVLGAHGRQLDPP
jgi:hypothetical protein